MYCKTKTVENLLDGHEIGAWEKWARDDGAHDGRWGPRSKSINSWKLHRG